MLGQAQEDLPLTLGDPGSHVQQPVAQGLGFGPVQVGFVAQEHRLGQGQKVRSDQGELDPDLVDVGVPGGQVPDTGVLAGSDPVLDAGVGAVPGVQEWQLPAGGVGGERLIPVTVTDLATRPGSRPGGGAPDGR